MPVMTKDSRHHVALIGLSVTLTDVSVMVCFVMQSTLGRLRTGAYFDQLTGEA
jgi:hypothetical protein